LINFFLDGHKTVTVELVCAVPTVGAPVAASGQIDTAAVSTVEAGQTG
jgi:hypothetical protein